MTTSEAVTQQYTATFIRRVDMNSGARLYRLNPPMKHESWDGEVSEYEYVIVSAVNVPFSGPETYIFGANEDGDVVNWSELAGSFRGGLDHERALNGAGYRVVA